LQSVCVYRSDQETIPVTVIALGPQTYRVVADEGECSIVVLSFGQDEAELQIDGKRMKLVHHREANGLQHIADATRSFSVINVAGAGAAGAETGGGRVMAPMHGLLLEVCVEAGQSVARGDKLAVLEAMKMQHEILAEIGGQVSNLGPKAGTQLAAGDLILEIAAE
jgi:geranyl-CoA carboxylase alpha subunit